MVMVMMLLVCLVCLVHTVRKKVNVFQLPLALCDKDAYRNLKEKKIIEFNYYYLLIMRATIKSGEAEGEKSTSLLSFNNAFIGIEG